MKNMNGHVYLMLAACASALALPLDADAVQISPADYRCSFSMSFPGYRGTTTLSDFPVLVRLSKELNDFRYSDCTIAEGGDLRFTDADGNLLASEVDTWTENGESLVWVKVPTFSSSTVVKAYYGYKGSATPPAVTASDVWSNGFAGVWHMGAAADAETQADSTANGKTLSKESASYGDGVLPGVAGKVGKAAEFGKRSDKKGGYAVDDSDDRLVGGTAVTLELWTYQDRVETTRMYLLAKQKDGGYNDATRSYIFFQWENRNAPETMSIFYADGDSGTVKSQMNATGYSSPECGKWNYNAVRYDCQTGNVMQFVNDERIINWTMSNYKGSALRTLKSGTFGLGNIASGQANAFPGKIDEVRVSTVARSEDWLRATHDTISDASFASFGVANDWTKYKHKFKVSFPGASDTPLAGFPVLVKLSEELLPGFRYSDCLKPNGGDLRFSDENGNLLASEVDTWDADGVSLVWVKVPSLTAATAITAYYGWELAPEVDSASVWANGYLGVWHMGDNLRDNNEYAVMQDSTGGGSTFTEDSSSKKTTAVGQDGVVGKSAGFGSGGMRNDSARVMRAGTSAATIELWTWQDDHDPSVASKDSYVIREVTRDSSASAKPVWHLYEASGEGNKGKIVLCTVTTSGQKWATPDNAKPLGARAEWNYHAATYDSESGTRVMLNAAETAKASSATGSLQEPLASSTMYLGSSTTGSGSPWPGRIDEVRISSVARSPEWVKATYDTIGNHVSFTKYGDVCENCKGLMLVIR